MRNCLQVNFEEPSECAFKKIYFERQTPFRRGLYNSIAEKLCTTNRYHRPINYTNEFLIQTFIFRSFLLVLCMPKNEVGNHINRNDDDPVFVHIHMHILPWQRGRTLSYLCNQQHGTDSKH